MLKKARFRLLDYHIIKNHFWLTLSKLTAFTYSVLMCTQCYKPMFISSADAEINKSHEVYDCGEYFMETDKDDKIFMDQGIPSTSCQVSLLLWRSSFQWLHLCQKSLNSHKTVSSVQQRIDFVQGLIFLSSVFFRNVWFSSRADKGGLLVTSEWTAFLVAGNSEKPKACTLLDGRVPTWYWTYRKSIALWNQFLRPWKSIEFDKNVFEV